MKLICTTDNPTDDFTLSDDIAKQDAFETTVLPAFRPDDVFKNRRPGFLKFFRKIRTS
ncbi:glucuronate isomerase [Staphylococcus aureus]|uniref:glucuronate isomerase n=1 Tax=Staphylococcus aureus TaxID=1280 RepID=UPI002181EE72|nr:glucuronate isomerase [Staphylococcus aureus]